MEIPTSAMYSSNNFTRSEGSPGSLQGLPTLKESPNVKYDQTAVGKAAAKLPHEIYSDFTCFHWVILLDTSVAMNEKSVNGVSLFDKAIEYLKQFIRDEMTDRCGVYDQNGNLDPISVNPEYVKKIDGIIFSLITYAPDTQCYMALQVTCTEILNLLPYISAKDTNCAGVALGKCYDYLASLGNYSQSDTIGLGRFPHKSQPCGVLWLTGDSMQFATNAKPKLEGQENIDPMETSGLKKARSEFINTPAFVNPTDFWKPYFNTQRKFEIPQGGVKINRHYVEPFRWDEMLITIRFSNEFTRSHDIELFTNSCGGVLYDVPAGEGRQYLKRIMHESKVLYYKEKLGKLEVKDLEKDRRERFPIGKRLMSRYERCYGKEVIHNKRRICLSFEPMDSVLPRLDNVEAYSIFKNDPKILETICPFPDEEKFSPKSNRRHAIPKYFYRRNEGRRIKFELFDTQSYELTNCHRYLIPYAAKYFDVLIEDSGKYVPFAVIKISSNLCNLYVLPPNFYTLQGNINTIKRSPSNQPAWDFITTYVKSLPKFYIPHIEALFKRAKITLKFSLNKIFLHLKKWTEQSIQAKAEAHNYLCNLRSYELHNIEKLKMIEENMKNKVGTSVSSYPSYWPTIPANCRNSIIYDVYPLERGIRTKRSIRNMISNMDTIIESNEEDDISEGLAASSNMGKLPISVFDVRRNNNLDVLSTYKRRLSEKLKSNKMDLVSLGISSSLEGKDDQLKTSNFFLHNESDIRRKSKPLLDTRFIPKKSVFEEDTEAEMSDDDDEDDDSTTSSNSSTSTSNGSHASSESDFYDEENVTVSIRPKSNENSHDRSVSNMGIMEDGANSLRDPFLSDEFKPFVECLKMGNLHKFFYCRTGDFANSEPMHMAEIVAQRKQRLKNSRKLTFIKKTTYTDRRKLPPLLMTTPKFSTKHYPSSVEEVLSGKWDIANSEREVGKVSPVKKPVVRESFEEWVTCIKRVLNTEAEGRDFIDNFDDDFIDEFDDELENELSTESEVKLESNITKEPEAEIIEIVDDEPSSFDVTDGEFTFSQSDFRENIDAPLSEFISTPDSSKMDLIEILDIAPQPELDEELPSVKEKVVPFLKSRIAEFGSTGSNHEKPYKLEDIYYWIIVTLKQNKLNMDEKELRDAVQQVASAIVNFNIISSSTKLESIMKKIVEDDVRKKKLIELSKNEYSLDGFYDKLKVYFGM